ncbi:MAG TPA: NAD(P)-dependent oxidoreductase, partial [Microthrixaceae bacterium]|nr:NAD(P)-dependent oxidoreductase [Microthrixaceae bacterium]HNL49648.1 NAD(P)-dependent oxidoreductase [Microthrixaceae bacterium]HNN40132.1 NAD(P)-dependent oxidoreductase [Microthrixaceae bacterium]
MSDGRRVVVLGRGFVGRAVDRRLRADPGHEVVVLEPADDAELAGRTPAGAERLRAAIGSSSKPVVINCCGRLRGTDEELLDANARWPQWLTEVLDGAAVRLVHLGSASEYGDPGGPTPLTEDTPARPTGSYGETKWAGTSSV